MAFFDATEVPANTGIGPVPEGDYTLIITESEMKPTQSNLRGEDSNEFLELTLEIIEGEYKNRKVWDRLNIKTDKPAAKKYAEGQLSAIMHAVMEPDSEGRYVIEHPSELHNKPLLAKVNYVPASGQYKAKNEIVSYKAIKGNGSVTHRATEPVSDDELDDDIPF